VDFLGFIFQHFGIWWSTSFMCSSTRSTCKGQLLSNP
jgi:hypothetical protein